MQPVTLWASGAGPGRVGLTVSSVLIGLGEPPVVVGLVDPDSDFALGLTDTLTVAILTPADRLLAEAFAGVAPAPGGPFRLAAFTDTDWGPVPAASGSWLGARVLDRRDLGWSTEVVATIEHVELRDAAPLAHVRGGYLTP